MSDFFNSYVNNEQDDGDINLRVTETRDQGGVEDMISPPHFGTMDRMNMPPTFADPEVAPNKNKQKYQSVVGFDDRWYEKNDAPI